MRASVALILGVCALAGCDKTPDGPKTYPVRGKVAYKGGGPVKPLESGSVVFVAVADPAQTYGGEIQDDGTFTLGGVFNGKAVAGVPEGKYRAAVEPRPTADKKAVHPRFTDPAKSGLEFTVAPGDNTFTVTVEGG